MTRIASLRIRTPDGIVPMELSPPVAPEFEMGGGGRLSTVGDYAKFAQIVLAGDVLRAAGAQRATVAEMGRNQLFEIRLRFLPRAQRLRNCRVPISALVIARTAARSDVALLSYMITPATWLSFAQLSYYLWSEYR